MSSNINLNVAGFARIRIAMDALPDAIAKFEVTAETAVLQVANRHDSPMPVRILGEFGYGDL